MCRLELSFNLLGDDWLIGAWAAFDSCSVFSFNILIVLHISSMTPSEGFFNFDSFLENDVMRLVKLINRLFSTKIGMKYTYRICTIIPKLIIPNVDGTTDLESVNLELIEPCPTSDTFFTVAMRSC